MKNFVEGSGKAELIRKGNSKKQGPCDGNCAEMIVPEGRVDEGKNSNRQKKA